MNKYAKILLVLFIIGTVAAIIFRPSGKLMSGKPNQEAGYLAIYEEALARNRPLFIEFYSRY